MFISYSSIDLSKRLDDSAINGLEGILNGNIPTADNLNVLKSLLECHQVSNCFLLQGCFISNSRRNIIDLSKKLDDSPSKYSSAAGLFHK